MDRIDIILMEISSLFESELKEQDLQLVLQGRGETDIELIPKKKELILKIKPILDKHHIAIDQRKAVLAGVLEKVHYEKRIRAIMDLFVPNFFDVTASGGLIVIRQDRSWVPVTKRQLADIGQLGRMLDDKENVIMLTSSASSDYIREYAEEDDLVGESLDEIRSVDPKTFQDEFLAAFLHQRDGRLTWSGGSGDLDVTALGGVFEIIHEKRPDIQLAWL